MFTRDYILNAAIEYVGHNGFENLSARSLAQFARCSIAPIYSSFASMEELKRQLLMKAKDLLLEYQQMTYVEDPLLNLAHGYAAFATEHNRLFTALFTYSNEFKAVIDELFEEVIGKVNADPRFSSLTREQCREFCMQMWVLTHGYVTLFNANFVQPTTATKDSVYAIGNCIVSQYIKK